MSDSEITDKEFRKRMDKHRRESEEMIKRVKEEVDALPKHRHTRGKNWDEILNKIPNEEKEKRRVVRPKGKPKWRGYTKAVPSGQT